MFIYLAIKCVFEQLRTLFHFFSAMVAAAARILLGSCCRRSSCFSLRLITTVSQQPVYSAHVANNTIHLFPWDEPPTQFSKAL